MVRVANDTNRIIAKFAQLRDNKQKALITYVTAGDPNLERTEDLVVAMEKAGADLVELGIPYSDPLADGPVIQAASQRALKSGTTLDKIFHMVENIRTRTQIPLILMTYINPILQYGVERFAARAAKAGVDGLIIPDLPVEEEEILSGPVREAGLVIIPLIAPTSTDVRIARIAGQAQGFIYCVSLTGVTGVREQLNLNIDPFLERVRKFTDQPLAVGFGVSGPDQARAVAQKSDGVIVGSALVKIIAEHGDTGETPEKVAQLVKNLKEAIA